MQAIQDRFHLNTELKPDLWNDWIALGGAIVAGLVWLWRHTFKALWVWFRNGLKAPQRIEEITLCLERMSHDLTTAVGLARATWDSIPCPIWQSDTLGLCVHVNLSYRDTLGYQFSEVSGLQWKQVIHPADKEMVYEEWDSAVRDQRPFDLRYRWISKTGKVIPVHAHASVLHDANGKIAGWVAFVTVDPKRTA